MITPAQFISKWRDVELTERPASQQHFLDLCEPLQHPKHGDLPDDELLARLLNLNLERAIEGSQRGT